MWYKSSLWYKYSVVATIFISLYVDTQCPENSKSGIILLFCGIYIKIFKNIIFEIQTRQTDKVLCVKLNVSCYKSKKNIDSMLRDMQKCIEKFVKLSGLNNWLNEHRHRYRMSY